MGEREAGSLEVTGSNPVSSTMETSSSFEGLVLSAFMWASSHDGTIVLCADNPEIRTVGFSCFVPGDPEVSESFELPLSETRHPFEESSCSWVARFARDRMKLAAELCRPDGKAGFRDHLGTCPICLPAYVMSL